jgi:hypothetical protein
MAYDTLGILVVIVIIIVVIVIVIIALSKGLVVAVIAKCILIIAIINVTLLGILQIPSLSLFFDGSRFGMLNKPNMMKLRSPNVLARSRDLSHPPSITPTCFWLVLVAAKY